MARRLTEAQKLQILQGFREGKSSSVLAQIFDCSANTVVRTIKNKISADEYLSLKQPKGKDNFLNDKTQKISSENPGFRDDRLPEKSISIDDDDVNQASVFKEVIPLVTDFGFEDRQQKVNCQDLLPGLLPETVYILVDKKIELERTSLSDLPDWDFLPDEEKERKVIPLFVNQREAKRSCSRSQRVIKIPDTSIFITTKSFLLAKGISRLVLEDSLIALDR